MAMLEYKAMVHKNPWGHWVDPLQHQTGGSGGFGLVRKWVSRIRSDASCGRELGVCTDVRESGSGTKYGELRYKRRIIRGLGVPEARKRHSNIFTHIITLFTYEPPN